MQSSGKIRLYFPVSWEGEDLASVVTLLQIGKFYLQLVKTW